MVAGDDDHSLHSRTRLQKAQAVTSATAEDRALGGAKRLTLSPSSGILLIGFVCTALLVLPGVTVVTKSLEELFLIFDGIHRIVAGQPPGFGLPSAYGPLALIVPALAYELTGRYGAALPLTMGTFVILMAVIASHVLATRLRGVLALAFAAFLLMILAAPMSLGDPVTALSFSRFDIRLGWVALSLLLVLYLRPYAPYSHRVVLTDAVCAAALTLVMIYTRATYAIVAVAFLGMMLTDRRQWTMAAAGLAIVAVAVLVVHVTWSGNADYFVAAIGGVREAGLMGGGLQDVLQRILIRLADFLLLGILAGLALWYGFRLRDLLFFLLCAMGGLFVIGHNAQPWGIITMHAAAVVAAELLLRHMNSRPDRAPGKVVNASGVKLFFFAFVLPTTLHCALALALHSGTATLRAGEDINLPRINGVRLANLWTEGDYRGQVWYLGMVGQGLDLLRQSGEPPGRFIAIGEVNIFPTILDMPPGTETGADLRWRSLTAQSPPVEPARRLQDLDAVLFRKTGESAAGLQQQTLSFLQDNYTTSGESEHWLLFRRAPVAGITPAIEHGSR
jgi:hypothetical protein